MKKVFALMLVLGIVLCGCTAQPAETTAPVTQAPTTEATVPTTQVATEEPTTVPTEEPTTAPTEPPVIANPLTGEVLEEPIQTRNFAVVINNVPIAMPVHGVSKADVFFEMYVNDYATRGLALFSDLSQVRSVGSVRSLRYNFTDLCQIFDAVVVHAGGSEAVLTDRENSGVDNVNAAFYGNYYYQDQSRLDAGYASEHTLMVRGAETVSHAENNGVRVQAEAGADYGLRFTEDGTPAQGEKAERVTISMIYEPVTKQSIMVYIPEQGKYQFNQYGNPVWDSAESSYVYFENVIVMLCNVYNDSVYHVADLTDSGEGYFACGGKIIPIRWSCQSPDGPILFTLEDGTPLELGIGNSYIAIAPLGSEVDWE